MWLPKPDESVSGAVSRLSFVFRCRLVKTREPGVPVDCLNGRVARSPFLKPASQNNWSRSKGKDGEVSQILPNKKNSDSKVSCASIPPVKVIPQLFAYKQTRFFAAVPRIQSTKVILVLSVQWRKTSNPKQHIHLQIYPVCLGQCVEGGVLGMNASDACGQQHPTA